MSTRTLHAAVMSLARWAEILGARPQGPGDLARPVLGIQDDSRLVTPGDLFFARGGAGGSGLAYAADAVSRGAIGVVSDAMLPAGIPGLVVDDVDGALEAAADTFHGRPQDALDLVGVTGTKGKTTTAWLVAAALRHAGRRTAILGTIAHDLGDGRAEPAGNTTPGLLELRRLLARARDAGSTAAVMEVSSHALDQGRTRGLAFRAGVFTNLGRDHLDYHPSLEAYFEAKSRLFRGLSPAATAVLNAEDESWRRLVPLCRSQVITYGTHPECDIRAHDIALSASGTTFRLTENGHVELDVRTRLVGRHNVLNFLAAVGAATALGADVVEAVEGASRLDGVPGRLQRVLPAGDLHVFVDYAHTEEALRSVLGFLREIRAEPLTCVVGCGGDRDRTKRPRMARAAAELADRVVLTSDNPRTEEPEAILHEMEAGLTAELKARSTTVVDRRAAIRLAIETAEPGSCVLVAGKGHERYQIVGERKIHFDDVEEVREALRQRAASAPGGAGHGEPEPR